MVTLSLLQAAATPAWVGPTMAISLAVIALSVLGMAIVVGSSVLRLVGAAETNLPRLVDTLQEDAQQALVAARRLTEQAQDLMVLVRHEAGAFAETSRRVRAEGGPRASIGWRSGWRIWRRSTTWCTTRSRTPPSTSRPRSARRDRATA